MKKLFHLSLLLVAAMLCACSAKNAVDDSGKEGDPSLPSGLDESFGDDGGDVSPGEGAGGEGQGTAGRVTAGEWRDLDNWLFWSDLMTNTQFDQQGSDYTEYSDYWGFYTNHRVAVQVTDKDGNPRTDVPVKLVAAEGGSVLYEARTDNSGRTNLWVGLTQRQNDVNESGLALVVGDQRMEQPVSVTGWGEEVKWNTCQTASSDVKQFQIAFIVDATGSMSDEIDFLKADLTNIITTVRTRHDGADIRTAALFYRDEGDDYLTRVSDFTSSLPETVSFIREQNADGGGDYPEAVHTALETGLQKLSWQEDGAVRLAFMLLDAPPHKRADVIASLQQSIPMYAKLGIRIIPVAASGVDKPTEFFLRFASIATDGTYVFITNHSGIGNDHMEATVGDYQVELLNELIIRLIDRYMQ